jgi:type II secretory pathway pseudopilin PulG
MLKSTVIRTKSRGRRSGEAGYLLITLMLFVTLLVIAATAVLADLKRQMERDREEEMIHRGVQYTRAIRRYYRKTGTYPTTLDQLESSTPGMRFLRKRYKDPVTGQDFRLLHMQDVVTAFGQRITGALTVAQMNRSHAGGDSGTTGDSTSSTSSTNADGQQTGNSGSTTPPADGSQQSGNSGASTSPFTSISGQPGDPNIGGGPIVGVASTSTKESVRIYDKKDHYKDWLFAYNPQADRGGLIVGPYQPPLLAAIPDPIAPAVLPPPSGSMPGVFTPGTTPMNPPQPQPQPPPSQ